MTGDDFIKFLFWLLSSVCKLLQYAANDIIKEGEKKAISEGVKINKFFIVWFIIARSWINLLIR